MLCCTLAGIAGAAAGAQTRHLKLVLVAATLGPLALGVWHLEHYAARAEANERDLLAEILAAPICTGRPTGPAITPSRLD